MERMVYFYSYDQHKGPSVSNAYSGIEVGSISNRIIDSWAAGWDSRGAFATIHVPMNVDDGLIVKFIDSLFPVWKESLEWKYDHIDTILELRDGNTGTVVEYHFVKPENVINFIQSKEYDGTYIVRD